MSSWKEKIDNISNEDLQKIALLLYEIRQELSLIRKHLSKKLNSQSKGNRKLTREAKLIPLKKSGDIIQERMKNGHLKKTNYWQENMEKVFLSPN